MVSNFVKYQNTNIKNENNYIKTIYIIASIEEAKKKIS